MQHDLTAKKTTTYLHTYPLLTYLPSLTEHPLGAYWAQTYASSKLCEFTLLVLSMPLMERLVVSFEFGQPSLLLLLDEDWTGTSILSSWLSTLPTRRPNSPFNIHTTPHLEPATVHSY